MSSNPRRSMAGLAALIAVMVPLGLLISPRAAAAPEPSPASPEQVAHFASVVRPVLEQHCLKCHGGEKVEGKFDLSTRERLIAGGEGGPSLDFKDLDRSRMLLAIRYADEDLQMPPKGKLKAADVEALTAWVKLGAPWPAGVRLGGAAHAPAEPPVKRIEAGRSWWSYRPVERPAAPAVTDPAWVANPIDAFILAGLERNGLKPNRPAERSAWIRRAYFDLIGLPPSPAEVRAFVEDRSPQAYDKVVDRLLESPHYGEKWGRHWLDIVRYADTNGYERDGRKPEAWRYRDYVIRALNQDMPYDRFLTEQIAGDEVSPVTLDSLTATGFYRLGIWDDEPADRELARYDVLDGVVSTLSAGVLGMSVGCARCHDHKVDPITQRDYYAMLAFVHAVSDMSNDPTITYTSPEDHKSYLGALEGKRKREAELHAQIAAERQEFKARARAAGVELGAVGVDDLDQLRYRFYRDTWAQLPDFDSLKPEAQGELSGSLLSLAPATRDEAMGLVFEGRLLVPQAGRYAFTLRSSAGARVIVDGRNLLENNEGRPRDRQAALDLPAGALPLRVEYFNIKDRPLLDLAWSGPGFVERALSEQAAERLAQDEGWLLRDARPMHAAAAGKSGKAKAAGEEWSYTFEYPGDGWTQPDFKLAPHWKRGRAGFGQGAPNIHARTPWSTPEVWLRKSFELRQAPSSLRLHIYHDEDVQVYINGEKVFEAGGYVTQYKAIDLPAGATRALRVGSNTLAVHCRQTGGGQYIDLGLQGSSASVAWQELVDRHGPKLMPPQWAQAHAAKLRDLAQLRKQEIKPTGTRIMVVTERGKQVTRLLQRGSPELPGDAVEPAFPEVLGAPAPTITPSPTGTLGRRTALAKWITAPSHPLTARVMANRLWQHHFGRGLSRTPNELGRLGLKPTHPELLDWLAAELRDGGWTLKRMHRLIMLSNAYRMSSEDNPQGLLKDPANDLFWRFDMRRLGAEEVRDAMLAINGTINLQLGGPSIYTEVPRAVLETASRPNDAWGVSPPQERTRRSVYIFIKRSLVEPVLQTFDFADTDQSCAVRFATTVPTQALTTLNSDYFNRQAALLAQRVAREAGPAPRDRAALALRLATGREPTESEVARGVSLVAELMTKHGVPEDRAWAYFGLVVLNLNEFMYLD